MATATKEKKAKAAKPKKPNKAARDALIGEKVLELIKQQGILIEAQGEWEEAHSQAGALKKTMDLQQAKLNSVVADIAAIQAGNFTPPLPFTGDLPTKAETNGQADEYWRGASLAEAGFDIDKKPGKQLVEAGLDTVGKIADWSSSGKRLTDVTGIGEVAAEQVESTLEKFWASKRPTESNGKAE